MHNPPQSQTALFLAAHHIAPNSNPAPYCCPQLSAGLLDDLHSFDPATMKWTLLSVADGAGRPSKRSGHGFTSAGGLLYLHGGSSSTSTGKAGGKYMSTAIIDGLVSASESRSIECSPVLLSLKG
jgi:hypothetical protein